MPYNQIITARRIELRVQEIELRVQEIELRAQEMAMNEKLTMIGLSSTEELLVLSVKVSTLLKQQVFLW